MLNIRQFLGERNFAVREQLFHSSDLALCDFFLFPKRKGIIKGTRFESVEAIKRAITMKVRGVPEKSFQQCIKTIQKRMGKGIILEWGYFEEKTIWGFFFCD